MVAEGKDGTNGTDGDDDFSPTATIIKSANTATIIITDKNGTTTASISDRADGAGRGSGGGSGSGEVYSTEEGGKGKFFRGKFFNGKVLA